MIEIKENILNSANILIDASKSLLEDVKKNGWDFPDELIQNETLGLAIIKDVIRERNKEENIKLDQGTKIKNMKGFVVLTDKDGKSLDVSMRDIRNYREDNKSKYHYSGKGINKKGNEEATRQQKAADDLLKNY